MISQTFKPPRFALFSLIKGIALAVHLRIMERRRRRIKLLPAAVEPVQPKLKPTEIEMLQVAEQVAVPAVLSALVGQQFLLETLPKPEPIALPEISLIQVTGQSSPVLQDTQNTGQQDTSTEIDRTTVVMQLLDEAHGRGCKTYTQLIDYVKQQTGTGCSKRMVANWKKQRGLAA